MLAKPYSKLTGYIFYMFPVGNKGCCFGLFGFYMKVGLLITRFQLVSIAAHISLSADQHQKDVFALP